MQADYAGEAEIGDEIKILLPSGTKTNATIEYKKQEGDEYIVTLKIEDNIKELMEYRKISFTIIWWSANGMRIPNVALSYEQKGENEVAYITRKRIEYEDKIRVKILKANDKYSIVTNYTSEELKELGYTTEEIRKMPSISIYDEILINK